MKWQRSWWEGGRIFSALYNRWIWRFWESIDMKTTFTVHWSAFRVSNLSTFKAHSNPLFSKLKVLNLDDTYKLCVLTFMHGYFKDNFPSSFQNIYLAEPNRTKLSKLERVININLESFPSEMFPKWNWNWP